MTLTKQLIDIPLQGLDTKTDPKLVMLGKMLELENARFERTGRISKHTGSGAIAIPSIGTPYRLYEYGGRALIADTGTGAELLRAYSAQQSDYVASSTEIKSNLAAPRVLVDKLSLQASTIDTVDTATNGNYRCSITRSTDRNGSGTLTPLVRITVTDLLSNVEVQSIRITGSASDTAFSPRVLAIPGAANFVVGIGSTSVPSYSVYEVSPTSATATLRTTQSMTTFADWAFNAAGTILMIVGQTNVVGTIRVTALTVAGWGSVSTTFAAGAAVTALCIASGAADARVFVQVTGIGIRTTTYSTALAITLALTTIVADAIVRNVMTARIRTGTTVALYAQENVTTAGATGAANTVKRDVSAAGAISNTATLYGGFILSKAADPLGTGRDFIVIGMLSSTTTTYSAYLVEFPGGGTVAYCRAKISTEKAVGITTALDSNGIATNLYTTTGSSNQLFEVAIRLVDSFSYNATIGGTAFHPYLATVDYTLVAGGSNGWHAVEAAGGLLLTGGFLQLCDGDGIKENGFLAAPVMLSSSFALAGGTIDNGTFSLLAIYEWTDATGRLHRSPVSAPISVTVTGAAANASITTTVTCYSITANTTEVPYVGKIVLYRTLAGGTTYYREQVVSNAGLTAATIAFVSTADTGLNSQETIYTFGGPKDRAQPDCPTCIAADKDRVYIVSGNKRSFVQPSQPIDSKQGLAFFPDISRPVTADGDDVVALERQDGRIFAFKSRRTLYAPGDGPDTTGANNTLGDFEILHLEIGARDQRHVIRTNVGIIAKGEKGFWLIGRDLQATYIGADVDQYNAMTLADACTVEDSDEVRFLLNGGSFSGGCELVFNTFFRTWSQSYKNSDVVVPIACATIGGVRHIVGHDHLGFTKLYKELKRTDFEGFYDDLAVNPVALRMVTSWLKLANIQGFQRLYELLILGEFKSAHTMQIRLAFDYVDTYVETHTITSANATIGSTAYQWKVKPAQQKCEAVKIEITDLPSGGHGTNYEGYNISGLAAMIGIKRGAFKPNTAKVV